MEIHTESLRLIVFLSGLATFFLIEGIVHARPWHDSRARRLSLHILVAALNSAILRLTVAAPLLYLSDFVSRHEWGLVSILGISGLPEILLTVFVLDMGDYWWHRANHRVPLFWRFHQVHHVDTHVDVTTSLRFHPGELLISGLVKASWIVLWGPSALGFAIFEALVTLSSQYHHSNIDFDDRVEEVVRSFTVTPRMHASHHSAETRSLDANFSTIFSFWDRLFGTYVKPTPEHLRLQGLPYGRGRELELRQWISLPFRRGPEAAGGGEDGRSRDAPAETGRLEA
jgi:sterol desaturase/sphingolipid hydroxylase (fatty acid hydroxylase superfamily)